MMLSGSVVMNDLILIPMALSIHGIVQVIRPLLLEVMNGWVSVMAGLEIRKWQ